MLNLGNAITVKEIKEESISREEVLASMIKFQEAYQTFVDYKNVCEIVVKAKASTESMAFANDLLKTSVENIEVSVEELKDKLKTAWNKFLAFWDRIYKYCKDAIKQKIKAIKNYVKTKSKSSSEIAAASYFPTIQVGISTNECRTIALNAQNCLSDNFASPGWSVQPLSVIHNLKFTSEKLDNVKDFCDWLKWADTALDNLNKIVTLSKKHINKAPFQSRGNHDINAHKALMIVINTLPRVIRTLEANLNKMPWKYVGPKHGGDDDPPAAAAMVAA